MAKQTLYEDITSTVVEVVGDVVYAPGHSVYTDLENKVKVTDPSGNLAEGIYEAIDIKSIATTQEPKSGADAYRLDNFDRSAGALSSNSVADIWQHIDSSTGIFNLLIDGDQNLVYGNDSATNLTGDVHVAINHRTGPVPMSVNHQASVSVYQLVQNSFVGPAVRVSHLTGVCYAFFTDGARSANSGLKRYDGSVWQDISVNQPWHDSSDGDWIQGEDAVNRITLRVVGDKLTILLNGVIQEQVVDSNITEGTRPGLIAEGTQIAPGDTTTTNSKISSFSRSNTDHSFRLIGAGSATQVQLGTVKIEKVTEASNSLGQKIKVGFDKIPAPVTKQFTQLVDNEGTLLFDDAGNPLVTEENTATTEVLASSNSLSVFVNNTTEDGGGGAIPIVEQFKEFSEVSSSILGVPRAEEQLSLFSDVATYGLDVDNWDATDFLRSHSNYPPEWYRKENPIHGRRTNVNFNEGSDEQALYIEAFPSQWSFPKGTKQSNRTTPTNNFRRYMNFIAMGRYLYDEFISFAPIFAKQNFISNQQAVILGRVENLATGDINIAPVNITLNIDEAQITGVDTFWDGSNAWYDVSYGDDLQECFDAIERFTVFFDNIVDRTTTFPNLPDSMISAQQQGSVSGDPSRFLNPPQGSGYLEFPQYRKLEQYADSGFLRPGGVSNLEYYGILQSKKTFRYQPGRVSGFTFGTRIVTNELSTDTTVEWGVSNSTDEYMFQLKGSRFAIVRRSTIQMPNELLERQGLTAQHQSSEPVVLKGVGNTERLYETIIPRTDFNGDQLLGSGNTGTFLRGFEQVTMYKIEFSWYGAIGAKFYAYVPVGTGEARWVLMHTFVIENGLGEPVLANPDFRFRYLVHTSDTSKIKSPVRLYKYGSSTYIDGGDEGTVRLDTTTVDSKLFTNRTPILGILPKEQILNTVGEGKDNFKKSYPSTVSVTSDTNCRLDFEEIKGSPQGVHFAYAPSISMAGVNPRSRLLKLRHDKSEGSSGKNIIRTVAPDGPTGFNIIPSIASVDTEYKVTVSGSVVNIHSNPGSYPSAFNDLQVGDSLTFGTQDATKYVIKKFNGAPEYSSSNKTTLTLEGYPDPSSLSYGGVEGIIAKVHYDILPREINSHIIANGAYGQYIGENDFLNVRRNNNEETSYDLVNGEARDSILVNTDPSSPPTIFNVETLDPLSQDSVFEARLSGYNTVVASEVGILSNNFKIHFMIPSPRDPGLDSNIGIDWYKHFAEFSVGVTPFRPLDYQDNDRSDQGINVEPQIKFAQIDNQGNPVQYEYDINQFPSIEYCHQSTVFDSKLRAETQEIDFSYGGRLSVDPRLDSVENKIVGVSDSRGYPATVSGEVSVNNYPFVDVEQITDSTLGDVTKINFSTGTSLPSADEIIPGLSEVGVNFGSIEDDNGTPYKFVSAVSVNTDPPFVLVEDGAFSTLNGLSNRVIQTKTITLRDDWRASSLVEGGTDFEERFKTKKFTVRKAVSFNTQPLYPVFALGDYSRVNSIVVEEIEEDGSIRTHIPKFVYENPAWNTHISTINTGGANDTQSPSAFQKTENLSSACRYDTSTQSPLRPGNVIYSYFVGAGETVQVGLSNIFERDRKSISRGALNNRAIFINATTIGSPSGNIQLSLTSKEQ